MKILDVGCGPGNITCDLAKLVPHGSVVGSDRSREVVDAATQLAKERGVTNVEFEVGNVFSLEYPDDTFDVVHAHQVLQHVGDASSAVREMRRVVKKGGIVAARDMVDYHHWPEVSELVRFRDVFFRISKEMGAIPGIGRQYRKVTREAGFGVEQVRITNSFWSFAAQEELDFWCGMWAERVLKSDFKDNAIKFEASTLDELEQISTAWDKFRKTEDAWAAVSHGEMICHK